MNQYSQKNIWIIAGTTEGRQLAEFVSELQVRLNQEITCYVSTATEYGKAILENIPLIDLEPGRKNQVEMVQFMQQHEIGLVIDATHPFAQEVTKNIKGACESENVKYVRCLRDFYEEKSTYKGSQPTDNGADDGADNGADNGADDGVVIVDCIQNAVKYLSETEGNILISTGSKELHLYTEIPDYQERCYARVLSTVQAVQESVRHGFEGKHLIAMQGPFSEELNLAMLKQVKASYFVTKNSGFAGGYDEKVKAAKKAGAQLVVIARPQEQGKSVKEVENIIEEFLANRFFL